MAEKKFTYGGKALEATVGLPSERAPGHTEAELIIGSEGFLDPTENPNLTGFRSGKQTDVVLVPYPEARWWSEKLGNKLVNATAGTPSTDIAIIDASGFAITDASGAIVIL